MGLWYQKSNADKIHISEKYAVNANKKRSADSLIDLKHPERLKFSTDQVRGAV